MSEAVLRNKYTATQLSKDNNNYLWAEMSCHGQTIDSKNVKNIKFSDISHVEIKILFPLP